jgi:hypothetical protein
MGKYYELHYTLNGRTECVAGPFDTRESAQDWLDECPSLRGSYVVEMAGEYVAPSGLCRWSRFDETNTN